MLLRSLLTLLAFALLAPATAAASKPPKPYKIFLYHLTGVEAHGEMTRTYTTPGGHNQVTTGTVDVKNTGLPKRGWRGRKNTGFWGEHKGWGVFGVRFGEERWTIQGHFQEPVGEFDPPGTPPPPPTPCGGTVTRKGTGVSGELGNDKNGKLVLELLVPSNPGLEDCELDEGFHNRGIKGPVPAKIRVSPATMKKKRFTIPFEHTLHRKFVKQPEDEHDTRVWTEEITVRWRGSITFERGYQCTVPPDYPCHTMLM